MYEVRTNRCDCNPETCCCNPYVVIDTDEDKRVATFFTIKGAQSLASKLNATINTDGDDKVVMFFMEEDPQSVLDKLCASGAALKSGSSS